MTVRVVLLSGPLAVGKTAVADALRDRGGLKKISSSGHLRQLAAERLLPESREILQQLGDLLDQQTDYAWLVEDVAVRQMADDTNQLDWFVDAVRKEQQVRNFRSKFSNVLHVHLTAPEDVLRSRFLSRARDGDDVHDHAAYDRCIDHPNEQSARALDRIADQIIDLSVHGPDEAAAIILAFGERPSCIESSF